jgi:hypothetical protein
MSCGTAFIKIRHRFRGHSRIARGVNTMRAVCLALLVIESAGGPVFSGIFGTMQP